MESMPTTTNKEQKHNLKKIIPLLKYLADNWLKLLIFYLLFSQIMRAMAQSQSKTSDNELIQSTGIYDDFVNFNYEEAYKQLIGLIATKKLSNADQLLDKLLIKDVPFEEYIILAETKMQVNYEMNNIRVAIDWAEKILGINPFHQLALANHVLLSIHLRDERNFFNLGNRLNNLSEEKLKLQGYYARAVFRKLMSDPVEYAEVFSHSGHRQDALYNVALCEDMIKDFIKCLQLSKGVESKAYQRLLDSSLDQYEAALQTNSYYLDFLNPEAQYTVFLNSASASHFQSNHATQFSAIEIKSLLNCAFIMKNDDFPTTSEQIIEHTVYVPINGTDSYYVYNANFDPHYFTLDMIAANPRVPIQISVEQVAQNVVGVLFPSGEITIDQRLLRQAYLRADRYHPRTLDIAALESSLGIRHRIHKNIVTPSQPDANSSYLWTLIMLGASLLGLNRVYWLFQQLQSKRAPATSIDKNEIQGLLAVLEKQTSALTSAKWQCQGDVLSLDLSTIYSKLDLTQFSRVYGEINQVSLDPDLLFEKLPAILKIFGDENITLNNKRLVVALRTDKLPKQAALENAFGRLYEELIFQSKEYQLPIFNESALKLEKNLKSKLIDINEEIKNLFATLLPAKLVIKKYLDNPDLAKDKELKEMSRKIDALILGFEEQIVMTKTSKRTIIVDLGKIKSMDNCKNIEVVLKKIENEILKLGSAKLYLTSLFQNLEHYESKIELALDRFDKSKHQKAYIDGLRSEKSKCYGKQEQSRYQKDKSDQLKAIEHSIDYKQHLNNLWISFNENQPMGNMSALGEFGLFNSDKTEVNNNHDNYYLEGENKNATPNPMT